MKPVAFNYVAAHSVEEAVAALGRDEDAKPIAGGQSLVPALNMRLVRPSILVDLNRAGLDTITGNGVLSVGATVRQAALERHGLTHPLVREALPSVGHFVTRNRGTVGGSIAHADGAAELPLCLAALGGTIVVAGPSGLREIAPEDFFVTHFLTTLAPGEIVVETRWPLQAEVEGAAFEEFALRAGDFALSMAAVVLRRVDGVARDVRIRLGSVTDHPTAPVEVENAIEGHEVTAAAAREAAAAAAASIDPAGSIHASPAYLRHLTGVLVERALLRAWERSA